MRSNCKYVYLNLPLKQEIVALQSPVFMICSFLRQLLRKQKCKSFSEIKVGLIIPREK